ncbi:MAG: hypothetical protein ABIS14_14565 [Sphingomonas sp.]
MLKVLLAGAALIAAPAFAQTTPAPDQAQTMPAPTGAAPMTTNGVPNTALSTSPTPSDGPRAQQGNSPANNDASMAGGGTPMSAPPTPTASTMDKPPVCKANEFSGCTEPGNGGGSHHHAAKHRARR